MKRATTIDDPAELPTIEVPEQISELDIAEIGEGLSPRELAFVVNLVLHGMPQSHAAQKAGYSQENAAAQASTMMKRPAIRHAVDRAKKVVKGLSVVSFQRKERELWRVATEARKAKRYADATGAIRELNLMHGDHAAQNVNLTVGFRPRIVFGGGDDVIEGETA